MEKWETKGHFDEMYLQLWTHNFQCLSELAMRKEIEILVMGEPFL